MNSEEPAKSATNALYGSSTEVRKATDQDLVGIVELQHSINTEECFELPLLELALLRHYEESAGHAYFVAVRGPEVVGYIEAKPTYSLSLKTPPSSPVLSLFVRSNCQGAGIGMQLLKELVCWGSADATIQALLLNVKVSNTRAISLYESLGFVEVCSGAESIWMRLPLRTAT